MKSKARVEEEKKRDEIIRALPTFINQLLLLLSSGMVLQEAMETIAVKYGEKDFKSSDYFTLSFSRIYEETLQNGDNFISGFSAFSSEAHIKELSRIARIITDSRDRGTEMWDKLAKEGETLWAERKRRAYEKIRMAESKMSFPLGIMLIALIVITAAPAMLQMYIN